MNPLVSFCLKSYNGRPYLREALDGAFAQTYRPLEIVISDDASTDGSWEVIQEEVAKRGKTEGVTVVVNRNERNLGSVGNWDRLCELASGELIVKADGDDVSLPERTERIVAAWLSDGGKATVICHSGWLIGLRGQRKGRLRLVTPGWPLGAAMAFSRRTFDVFGYSLDSAAVDDEVYVRRALMLGKPIVMPDRLVRYRIGHGQTSDEWHVRRVFVQTTRGMLAVIREMQGELERVGERLGEETCQIWRKRLLDEKAYYSNKQRLLEGETFRERLSGFRKVSGSRLLGVSNVIRSAFLLPRPIGDVALFGYAVCRNVLRRTGVL